jgi:hypothetical protein
MVERSRGDPMTACYIDSSFPALLHFAYKYADSPEKAVLANANAGIHFLPPFFDLLPMSLFGFLLFASFHLFLHIDDLHMH